MKGDYAGEAYVFWTFHYVDSRGTHLFFNFNGSNFATDENGNNFAREDFSYIPEVAARRTQLDLAEENLTGLIDRFGGKDTKETKRVIKMLKKSKQQSRRRRRIKRLFEQHDGHCASLRY